MKKAFTMIELIFAIVIIGILSAVALPKFFDLRFKTELTSLKTGIDTINSKANNQLLKNIIKGQNESYQDFETATADTSKIFTNLFKDGLDRGDEDRGWFFLGLKEKTSTTIIPWYVLDGSTPSATYDPELDYGKYLAGVSDRTQDGIYLIYKYSINSNIYFNLIYKSLAGKFECAKATCNGCNRSRIDSINNLIPCFEPATI